MKARGWRGFTVLKKPTTALFLSSNVVLFMLSILDFTLPHLSLQVGPLVLQNHPVPRYILDDLMKLLLIPVELVVTMLFGDNVCDFQRDKSLFG